MQDNKLALEMLRFEAEKKNKKDIILTTTLKTKKVEEKMKTLLKEIIEYMSDYRGFYKTGDNYSDINSSEESLTLAEVEAIEKKVILLPSFLEDVSSLKDISEKQGVVLAEKHGTTSYKNIDKTIELFNRREVCLIGIVTI